MNEYYGNVSFSGTINFGNVKANSVEEAKEIILNNIIGISIDTKDDVEIGEIDWDLHPDGVESGLYISPIEIEKES